MATGYFRAFVQHGDWTGTVSADNLDNGDLRDLLVAKKLMDPEEEFLIGVSLRIGENYPGKVWPPSVSAIIADGKNFDEVTAWLETQRDPIPTRNVDWELTLEQFMGLFKRFAVVLTRKGIPLQDREYEYQEE
jgi:hypothetical protein